MGTRIPSPQAIYNSPCRGERGDADALVEQRVELLARLEHGAVRASDGVDLFVEATPKRANCMGRSSLHAPAFES